MLQALGTFNPGKLKSMLTKFKARLKGSRDQFIHQEMRNPMQNHEIVKIIIPISTHTHGAKLKCQA